MVQILQKLDTQLFLFLNSLHTNWLDPVMALITRRDTWFPAYLVLIFWLIYKNKREGVFQIVSIVLAILLADQLCSGILKPFVARLRPCYEPSLNGLIHLVTECGGQFGFCSSHAANSFALATSVYLFFGKNKYTISLFFWALIVSYSRIYVGVHYPVDILFGGLIGVVFAHLSFNVINLAKKRYFS
jgi:undecaprenyl-diphosphatase